MDTIINYPTIKQYEDQNQKASVIEDHQKG